MNPETSPHPSHEDLYAYRDGELVAERRRVIEAHVVGCRACRESIDEISELEAQLRLAPDGVDEGYYDRLVAQAMDRVRAADVVPRVERRRSAAEVASEETRRAPRFPWAALTSAVGAAATVVVVVVLLMRQGSVWRSAPEVAVLERSAPDAARRGSVVDTTVPPSPGPPQTRATTGGARLPTGRTDGEGDEAAKKDAAATIRSNEELLAKSETGHAKLKTRDETVAQREVVGLGAANGEKQAADAVRQEAPKVAAAPPAEIQSSFSKEQAASESGYAVTLRRYALPPVWGPGVSDDLVLRAEPALRNLYRTGGAVTALDSARVRLYLAEAARIRLGSDFPDSATVEEITHHYQRAIQLGGSDAVTRNTARARLDEFQREVGEP
jgi:Putative zinc-finger